VKISVSTRTEVGKHTLIYGDCRNVLRDIRIQAGERIQLTVTSPPYAYGKEYEKGKDEQWLWDLIGDVAPLLFQVTKPSGFCVINFGASTRYEIMPEQAYVAAFRGAGWILHSRRVWMRPIATMSLPGSGIKRSIPIAEFENLFTFRKPPNGDERPWLDRPVQRVLATHAVWDDTLIRRAAEKKVPRTVHPACFPMALPVAAIRLWSQPGDVVLDPFGGCFTTVMAAHHEGRTGMGVEQVEKYFEHGLRRVRDYVAQERLSYD